MGFLHPELLLVALPAAWWWWRTRTQSRGVLFLRALVLALLVLALGSPYLKRGDVGRDLVIVVDRSRSMPAQGDRVALELIALAEDARKSGDRVGVVAFGRNAAIEHLASGTGHFGGFQKSVDGDGSDLGVALDTALDLIPSDRPGSILLVSDGEGNGHDALAAARRAVARNVRVDADFELERDGVILSHGRRELEPDSIACCFATARIAPALLNIICVSTLTAIARARTMSGSVHWRSSDRSRYSCSITTARAMRW